MEDFRELLDKHTEAEEKRFNSFENKLDVIKDNHLAHLETTVSNLQISDAAKGKDIEWIKWIVLLVLGVSVTGVVTAILNLIIK
jgi:hypothetical protein